MRIYLYFSTLTFNNSLIRYFFKFFHSLRRLPGILTQLIITFDQCMINEQYRKLLGVSKNKNVFVALTSLMSLCWTSPTGSNVVAVATAELASSLLCLCSYSWATVDSCGICTCAWYTENTKTKTKIFIIYVPKCVQNVSYVQDWSHHDFACWALNSDWMN